MSDRFSLANERHLGVFLCVLFATGAMCHECGYGTRVTSKRWAKCKQCGARVERRSLESLDKAIAEKP